MIDHENLSEISQNFALDCMFRCTLIHQMGVSKCIFPKISINSKVEFFNVLTECHRLFHEIVDGISYL